MDVINAAIWAVGCSQFQLKAHCRDADWINKTIKKKRIKQGSVISLYSEIH